MPNTEVSNFEVGAAENYGSGEVTGTAVVTEVDAAAGTVTVDSAPPAEVPKLDPVEDAAMRFTTLLPYIKKFAHAAEGKRSLIRVMYALAEFPLGKGPPRLLSQNERQLFQVMTELSQYKSTILTSIIKNQIPKAGEGSTNESDKSKE